MAQVLKENKGRTIKLGGKDYKLAPFTLNTMAEFEEVFDCGIDQLQELMESRPTGTLRKLLYVFLKENYPDMTIEKAGRLVPVKDLKTVIDSVLSIMNDIGE